MDLLRELGHLAGATRFRRISERLHVDGDKIYSDAGIDFKASWFSVFYTLANADHPLTVMEITHRIDFTNITVKNVVRELEKEDYVEVRPNPSDGRSKLISLSGEGKTILKKLRPLWASFTQALQTVFERGHPDILNILDRIDESITSLPIHERVRDSFQEKVTVIDYRPSLQGEFYRLAAPWLKKVVNGNLEKEDEETLQHPEKTYLQQGGFLFFAQYEKEIIGCVALKRLDDSSFEFAKLFIDPDYRGLGIATRLIERCITRCAENDAEELWLQTTLSMPKAHKLYYKLGFVDKEAPAQMQVLQRTEKIMYKVI